jgi:hypothetical protein
MMRMAELHAISIPKVRADSAWPDGPQRSTNGDFKRWQAALTAPPASIRLLNVLL